MKPFLLVVLAASALGQGENVPIDFRGDLHLGRFRIPPENRDYITAEPAGVCIDVPGKVRFKEAVGLVHRTESHPLGGDVELTVGYELLAIEGEGTAIWGPGIQMYLMLNNAREGMPGYTGDGITIARQMRANVGDIVAFSHRGTDEKGNRVNRGSNQAAVDPKARAGRLRLARKGGTLAASFTEGLDGAWRSLGEYPIGTENFRMLRLAVDPTNQAHVAVRLIDFHLKTEGAGGEARAVAETPAAAPTGDSGRRHVLWIFLVITGLVLIAAGVVWAWRGKRQSAEPPSAPTTRTTAAVKKKE